MEQWLASFLLLLARVGGVVALAPIPGTRLFPAPAKAALAVLLAWMLAPLGQMRAGWGGSWWTITAGMLGEAGFGLGVGVLLQVLNEALGMAAQLLGFQAGYSYINTIDPTSQVDATVLNVLLTLLGGLLFFSLDLDLHLVRAVAVSLERIPLGEFGVTTGQALAVGRVTAGMFEVGVRLAFPVVALLVLLDVALALLSYVNARMQLLTLSFPVKILVTLAALWALLDSAPALLEQLARRALELSGALARAGAGN